MNSGEMSSAQITDYLKQAVELESTKYELSTVQEQLPVFVNDFFRNRNPLPFNPENNPSFQEREPVLEFSEHKPFIERLTIKCQVPNEEK